MTENGSDKTDERPAETEPVQEQPKLSREEYAAQKKAEREELWTRIDALTVDAFKDGSSLRGFFGFHRAVQPGTDREPAAVPQRCAGGHMAEDV